MIPEQIRGILRDFIEGSKEILGEDLVGVYLHGSSVMGCFNPRKSDIDIIIVIERPISDAVKREFMEMVVRLNSIGPAKGIEMSVVLREVCRPFKYPTPYELHFSAGHLDWYKEDPEGYVREMNGTDKDLAAHFTIINKRGVCLYGAPIEEVFAEVPARDYMDSIWFDVEGAAEEITEYPLYLTLNLARVLAYKEDGLVLSKKEGAEWALGRLPAEFRPLIQGALREYCCDEETAYDGALTERYARYVTERIKRDGRIINGDETNMKYEFKPMTGEEESLVMKKIIEYADSMAGSAEHTEEESLVFKIENEEGKIIAGCILNIHEWGRAVLGTLWADEKYRRHGLGSMLIRAAENAAREKGCYYLCLGTMDYMARPLYEKHGFTVFTVNKDIPKGHVGWSLSKRLDRGVPDYVPTDNTAAELFKVVPGTKEDAEAIRRGLDEFCEKVVQERHGYITLSKKLVDEEGNTIAAIAAGIDSDDAADIDGIWVDEAFRGQGLGRRLLSETEREMKEKGAYVLLAGCCDWVSGFFFKSGFTTRGVLPDYPKGHTAYELEKRI
jgi:streptomycin 3"-adenylyltransferase